MTTIAVTINLIVIKPVLEEYQSLRIPYKLRRTQRTRRPPHNSHNAQFGHRTVDTDNDDGNDHFDPNRTGAKKRQC